MTLDILTGCPKIKIFIDGKYSHTTSWSTDLENAVYYARLNYSIPDDKIVTAEYAD